MKLLMITQKIDKNDDILGVYHEWAREIAKSFDKLSVVCLYEGKNELPSDVKVFSLGKEKNADLRGLESGFTRIRYLKNFFFFIWTLRKDYDAVFVHMNPVYVLLGWPLWKLLGKRVYLWFAHPAWNWQVKLAYLLSDGVVTSVPEAFYKKGGKVKAIGQGIDTELFKNTSVNTSIKSSILYLGRVSQSKNIHILIEALNDLAKAGIPYFFNLVGSPPQTSAAMMYDKKVKNMISDLGMQDATEFHGSVPYIDTASWYKKSEVFVNLSPTGYFDKTVLEAMSSGCITLASNDAYFHVFPKDLHELLMFRQNDVNDLAERIKGIIFLSEARKAEIGHRLRKIVVQHHSMYTLGERIRRAMI